MALRTYLLGALSIAPFSTSGPLRADGLPPLKATERGQVRANLYRRKADLLEELASIEEELRSGSRQEVSAMHYDDATWLGFSRRRSKMAVWSGLFGLFSAFVVSVLACGSKSHGEQDISAAGLPVEEPLPLDPPGTYFRFKTFFAYAGPGWLMSLAYVDPGNLEADLQSGAYAGYSFVWILCLSTFVGLLLQVLAARLGAVTGKDLAKTCRIAYSPNISFSLWVMIEIAIIGADIQQIVGSAIAFKELFGWPLWLGSILTALDSFIFLFLNHHRMRLFEALICMLVLVMLLAFFINCSLQPPPLIDVVTGFLPRIPKSAMLQFVGTVGSVIAPHNIYLHSGLISRRSLNQRTGECICQSNKYFAIDSAVALCVSFLINLALVTSFATNFFSIYCATARDGVGACIPGAEHSNATNVQCTTTAGLPGRCGEITLENSCSAIEKVFGGNGRMARIAFAMGLLAAGQAATLTTTLAGQYAMEGFLQWQIPAWQRAFVTRGVSLVPAVAMGIVASTSPSLEDLANEWINILQSIQLPFALVPLLCFTSSSRIMGTDFVNGHIMSLLCWASVLLITCLNVYLLVITFKYSSLLAWLLLAMCFSAYIGFISLLIQRGTS